MPPSDTFSPLASTIHDAGSLHRYRTEIPNTVIRGAKRQGLSVHAKWLYVYLKSVAGESGSCWQSTDTIARESGISQAQVSREKRALVAAGLIHIQPGARPARDSDTITLLDIWPENMQEFAKPAPPGRVSVRNPSLSARHSRVSHRNPPNKVLQEDPSEEDPEKKKDPPFPPTQRDPDALAALIASVWPDARPDAPQDPRLPRPRRLPAEALEYAPQGDAAAAKRKAREQLTQIGREETR